MILTVMDYICLTAIAIGIFCIAFLFYLHDFDVEEVFYED